MPSKRYMSQLGPYSRPPPPTLECALPQAFLRTFLAFCVPIEVGQRLSTHQTCGLVSTLSRASEIVNCATQASRTQARETSSDINVLDASIRVPTVGVVRTASLCSPGKC